MNSGTEANAAGPTPRTYLGIFLISLTVLSVQVCLARLFSVIIWYHFGFFVISVALLGFSAAGVFLTLRERAQGRTVSLGRNCLLFALFVVVGLAVSLNLDVDMVKLKSGEVLQFIYLGVILVLTSVPYFFGGVVVVGALSAYRDRVNTVYFANLLGSGVGCLASIVLLDWLGGPGALLANAFVAGVAGIVISRRRLGLDYLAAGVFLVVVVVLGIVTVGFPRDYPFLTAKSAKAYKKRALSEVELRRWNSSSMVDFFEGGHVGFWEPSPLFNAQNPGAEVPETKGINIDSWAWTSIINHVPGKWDRLKIYDYLPTTFFYRAKVPEHMLIIGAGGGTDVLAALYFGAKKIEAVEINPILVEAVGETFADWAGHIYDDPRVDVICAEGRHYLERSGKKYDAIQISGIDTFAASQAGAFALSENYLYTAEAFDAYFEHLKDDGYLVLMRWLYDPPRQSLRMFATTWEALQRAGVKDPTRHAFIVSNSPMIYVDGKVINRPPYFSVMVAKRTPLTEKELDDLELAARSLAFPMLYTPRWEGLDSAFIRYAKAADKAAFKRAYDFKVDPCTDESPFFFENAKWSKILSKKTVAGDAVFSWFSGQMVLLATLAFLGVVGALLLLLPLLRRRWIREEAKGGIRILPYFALLGVAFILLEIGLMQRFTLYLGHPVHALSVVLFSLLTFSGLGSFAAGIFKSRPYAGVVMGTLCAAALAIAYRWVLPAAFAATLDRSEVTRVLIAMATLAPLGFVMGMPFPSGIRLLEGLPGGVVSWAWALNGYLSVVGSVLAVILAMTWGFATVQLLAAGAYVLATVVALAYRSRQAPAGS